MPANSHATPVDTSKDFEAVLVRAGTKERAKIEKHLTACDAEAGPGHARLFRWAAARLGTLAPVGTQSVGNNTWRFFVPDGKFRMQVFALEDPCDGTLRIYLPDILAEAVKAKILTKTKEPNEYTVRGSRLPLRLEALDASNTPEPAAHVKHMLGWNRKALRLTLATAEPDSAQATAADALFAVAAKHWATPAANGG